MPDDVGGPRRQPAHVNTELLSTGHGMQAAAIPGRLARGPQRELSTTVPAAKWAPPCVPPRDCPSSGTAAVQLELSRAAALDTLRASYASMCARAGLRNVPLLSFERWRFAAKWAEDEPQLAADVLAAAGIATGASAAAAAAAVAAAAAGAQTAAMAPPQPTSRAMRSSDPVLPFGSLAPAPELGLVTDLMRAGMGADDAAELALRLAQRSHAAAQQTAHLRHALASGKPPTCPVMALEFGRHSVDITVGGRFVKVSRASYGKLARMYRAAWVGRDSTGSCKDAAAMDAAAADDAAIGCPLDGVFEQLKAWRQRVGAVQSDPSSSDSGSDRAVGGETNSSCGKVRNRPAAVGRQRKRIQRDADLFAEADIAKMQLAAAAAAPPLSAAAAAGEARRVLHERLFALLLRYKSILGHGFQAAAGPPVFEALRRCLGVGFEACASPLNATFSRFGSAFSDVDAPFGSSGSIFRLRIAHGSVEVNPPFVPSLITATALHLLRLLGAAEAGGRALSFAVLLPCWTDVPGWCLLRASTFLTCHVLLPAADHGYCDGASHQRQDVYRQSPYDSGVLVLQTSAAAAKWRVSERLERQLVDAFAACCPSAAAVERQRRRRGAADLELQGLVGGSGGGSAGGGSSSAQAAMCGEQQQQQHKKKMKQQQQQKLLKRQRRAKRLPSIAAMTEADMQDMASKATAKRARSSKHTVPDT